MYDRLAEEHREAVVSDAVEEGAALCIGDQLDFLQKELERLQVLCVCVCTHVCPCVCMCCRTLCLLVWRGISALKY